MITITNVTTNGTFEWSNETLQGTGNFTKNDSGEIVQLYFNGSYKLDAQSQCQLSASKNGSSFYFNINCDNLALIIAFATNAPIIIQELSTLQNGTEATEPGDK